MVIKVVLHSLHYLIVLVSLAGHQYHIAWFGKHAGGAYCLAPVHDAQHTLALLFAEPSKHIVDNGLRVLEARVVTCDYHPVAVLDCHFRHDGPLAAVTVAARTAHCPALPAVLQHIVDGLKHIDKGIRCMGIIDDGSHALG